MHEGKGDFAIAHVSILQHISILQVLEYFAGIPGVFCRYTWSILQHVIILQVLDYFAGVPVVFCRYTKSILQVYQEYFAGVPGVLAWRAWEERGAEERTSKLPGATFTIFTPLQ